jgi:hypothetical protein
MVGGCATLQQCWLVLIFEQKLGLRETNIMSLGRPLRGCVAALVKAVQPCSIEADNCTAKLDIVETTRFSEIVLRKLVKAFHRAMLC